MVRPWSDVTDPRFLQLLDVMRRADSTVVNLETVIHTLKGYPQADSGGLHLVSPPEIAKELKWAGVDAVPTANNHSFDYGEIGILETIQYLNEAGIAHAGTGPDLQTARSPCYWDTSGGRHGLVSMTASFAYYGKAAWARPDIKGRPGVNPLTLNKGFAIGCPPDVFARFRRKPGAINLLSSSSVRWRRMRWEESERWRLVRRTRPVHSDLTENCATIRSASANSNLTIVSLHSHNEKPWLKIVCRKLLDNGADIVFVQGQHAVRGIEIYRRKPIFYGLGDFVFQTHLVTPIASESYTRRGLPVDASAAEYGAARRIRSRIVFEGAAAIITTLEGQIRAIKLLPIDLQPDAEAQVRGTPRLAEPDLGRRIIDNIARKSRQFGTRIQYDHTENVGIVDLAGQEQ